MRDEERLANGKHSNQEHSAQSIQDHLKAAVDSGQALSILKAAIASRVSLALGSSKEDIDKPANKENVLKARTGQTGGGQSLDSPIRLKTRYI